MNKKLHKRTSASLPKLLWLMLLTLLPTQLSARDFEYTYEGQTLTYTVLDEDAKTVSTKAGYSYSANNKTNYVSGNKASGDLVIPKQVSDGSNTYSVTEIGDYGFFDCNGLTSIIIPNSVKSVSESAFEDCTSLKKGAYPSGLSYPFVPGSGVLGVQYPADGEYIVEDGCLWTADKTGLYFVPVDAKGEFSIPNSVTTIGDYAFIRCTGLTCVSLGNAVTSIGWCAFEGCTGLTSIIIPNSMTEIAYSSFKGCSGLTSIIIPNSVTKIGSHAFEGCTGLTSVIIPNSVTSCYGAFDGCTGLKKSAYPSGQSNPFRYGIVVEYPADGEYSFDDGYIWTTDKTELYFVPMDVEGEFTLPVSLTTIGSNAFDGCDAITALNVEGSVPAEFADNSFPNYDIDVTVPTGTLADYITSDWIKFPNLKDASGITTPVFSDDVFQYRRMGEKDAVLISGNYDSMTTVSIPERVVYDEKFVYVTAIADAFTDCSNMTSLVLPKRLTKILNNAFKGCTGLTEVNFPATLTAIGNSAFEGCTGLTSFIPGESLESVGESAFYGCKALTDVKVTWAEVAANTFANTGLTNLELTDAVDYIDQNAFYNCTGLTDVTFPESLTAIENSAFEGCTKLAGVTIPNAVTSIGDRAFYNCSALASFTPGESLEYVGESAFYGCKALTDVKVTWADVAANTFAYSGLTNLNHTDAVESIGANAFRNAYLSAISIPSSVNSIADEAFANAAADNNGVVLTLEDGLNALDINRDAFYSTAIPSVYIGRELESYESFSSKVNKVDFGNAVTSIPANAFNGNSRLNTVSFGSSIETIGDNAFNGCALTELVLPPHVKTVGNNAFASNAIKNIAIGSEVTEIGEKAFDGANQLAGVSITAVTPPMANNNTFSYYDCPLYVTPGCVDTYYDFIHCWYRFSGYDLIPADKVEIKDEATITLMPGESLQLSAAVVPANASLPYIFWRSSNPEFATVDSEGNVTRVATSAASAQADEGEDDDTTQPQSCKIYAETLYADVVASIMVKDVTTEIEDIATEDSDAAGSRPGDIFNLQGICLKRNASQADIDALTPGLYIIAGQKVLVK